MLTAVPHATKLAIVEKSVHVDSDPWHVTVDHDQAAIVPRPIPWRHMLGFDLCFTLFCATWSLPILFCGRDETRWSMPPFAAALAVSMCLICNGIMLWKLGIAWLRGPRLVVDLSADNFQLPTYMRTVSRSSVIGIEVQHTTTRNALMRERQMSELVLLLREADTVERLVILQSTEPGMCDRLAQQLATLEIIPVSISQESSS